MTRVSARTVGFAIPAGSKKTIAVRLNRKSRRLVLVAGNKGVHVRLRGDQVHRRDLLLRPATGQ